MNRSSEIDALASALAKAQSQILSAKKDSENPYFRSKYADLASVWEAIRQPLSVNGLSIVQTPEIGEGTTVAVETLLLHSSGQWVSGRCAAAPVKADPQGIGSVITYLRRYALAAIVGVAPEDDDGAAASGTVGTQKTGQKTPAAPITTEQELAKWLGPIEKTKSLHILENYGKKLAKTPPPDQLVSAVRAAYKSKHDLLAREAAAVQSPPTDDGQAPWEADSRNYRQPGEEG